MFTCGINRSRISKNWRRKYWNETRTRLTSELYSRTRYRLVYSPHFPHSLMLHLLFFWQANNRVRNSIKVIKLKLKINFRILPTPQGKTRLQSPYIPHHIPARRVLTVRFLHHSLVWVSRWSLVQVSYEQAIPLYEYIHTSPPRVMIFFEGARKVIFWGGKGLLDWHHLPLRGFERKMTFYWGG